MCLQPSDPEFSSQIMVYKDIGEEMLQHAFDGELTVKLTNLICLSWISLLFSQHIGLVLYYAYN